MATLIKQEEKVVFKQGDRVQFKSITTYDNYSPGYRDLYGTVNKINKVSMIIEGVDGNLYNARINEVKHYVDPFLK
jgi:hypothetical protein